MPFIQKIGGTCDVFPEDHKYFTFLKKVFRHEFRKNGFRRISTPLFESRETFEKAFWKWNLDAGFYEFTDTKGHTYALRVDASVWALRAYIEWQLDLELQPVYLYHMDRYFRKDSLWVWESKEFYFIWWEVIGEADPIIDAQQIYLNYETLNDIWLGGDFEVRINYLWNKKEIDKYIEELKSFYTSKKHLLSEASLYHLEHQPLKLLQATNEDEKILVSQAPSIVKFLKKDSKEYYAKIKEYLDMLKVPYIEDHTLVHYFDYYSGFVWKIDSLIDQQNIALGGRYDGLSQRLEHNSVIPASGFTVRVDQLISSLKAKNISIKNKDKIDLYFVQLWDEAKKAVLPLSLEAREKGINTLASLGTPAIKEQMLKAQRIGAKFVVIVGVMEARNGKFQLRNMEEGTQTEVHKDKLIDYIIDQIGKESLDFYSPARDLLMWDS